MKQETRPIQAVGFDADDTLWHNENIFSMTKQRFLDLLAPYHDPEWVDQKLYETEMGNLRLFGYGIKGFTLSMIETAIELSEGRIRGHEIQEIINFAKEMRQAPVDLLPGVREVVEQLAADFRLLIITKGDLIDQETKIARSGLVDLFDHIEIVSEKQAQVYAGILDRHGIESGRFLMVGNSLPSDVLPVVEIGGHGVHIPYHLTWQHETTSDADRHSYHQLKQISDLPALIATLV